MSIERPEWDASCAVWQGYCDHLNTVKFSNADQMHTGFVAIMRERKHPEDLRLFVRGFAGHDPETVTAALRARYEIWVEAQDCGVDLKESALDVWAALATRPLTPEDFNVFPAFADAEA
ncbi:hypothetical protein EP837_03199 [Sphingobium sp. EP60837]|nr:hypothetical protein EP837_03199 [Sphingobium sp. EP60837]